jgi:hypothetical protein
MKTTLGGLAPQSRINYGARSDCDGSAERARDLRSGPEDTPWLGRSSTLRLRPEGETGHNTSSFLRQLELSGIDFDIHFNVLIPLGQHVELVSRLDLPRQYALQRESRL